MNYKGFRVEPLGTFPMYKVMAVGSGRIPDILGGTYTTAVAAQRGIDAYLASLIKSKRVKYAEKENETTG